MNSPRKKAPKSRIRLWGNPDEGQVTVRDLKLDAIFREAALAFRWNGYHGTSLDDIARQLGVAKATLYYYFSNKQELFFHCHIAAADQAIASVSTDAGADGLERFRLSMQRYTASIIGSESYSVVILEERSLSEEQLQKVIGKRDEFERRLQEIIVAGQKDGSIIPCSPKFAVFAALGATNWITKWYRPGGSWSVEDIAEAMALFIVRGLSTHPERLGTGNHILAGEIADLF
ncbi:TetR/AcrR family transcriptional regulator [Castellaniella sp. GW247-6E4]|uniref:TetR/AcrR family transcriptional regulator n=1 Tax=Castellaniella sp. GW247-6E4 TaxID=3140380 RepID=UPI0033152E7A